MNHSQSWPEVLSEERLVLGRRSNDSSVDPSYVGMAMSGGGIRSAIFALGVLETFKRLGILARFDYLSTVGGGGYIGAWLTAGCHRNSAWLDAGQDGDPWQPSINYLRANANSLAPPTGLFDADTWAAVGHRLRALILNFTIFGLVLAALLYVPWIVASAYLRVVFLPDPLWGIGLAGVLLTAVVAVGTASVARPQSTSFAHGFVVVLGVIAIWLVSAVIWSWARYGDLRWVDGVRLLRWATGGGVAYAVAWVIGLSAGTIYGRVSPSRRFYHPPPTSLRTAAVLVASAAVAGFISSLLMTLAASSESALGPFPSFADPICIPVAGVLCLLVGTWVHMGLAASHLSEETREWWGRISGLQLLISLLLTLLAAIAFAAPHSFSLLGQSGTWLAANDEVMKSVLVLGWLGVTAAGVWAAQARQARRFGRSTVIDRVIDRVSAIAPAVFVVGCLCVLAAFFHSVPLIGVPVGLSRWPTLSESVESHFEELSQLHPGTKLSDLELAHAHDVDLSFAGEQGALWVMFSGLVGLAWLLSRQINLNGANPTGLYRNRLSRCFLGASRTHRLPNSFTGFDEKDDLPLAVLASDGQPSRGPLHIVNCSLDAGARRTGSFTMSALHCGSSRPAPSGEDSFGTYVATRLYGGRSLTLAQAVAVSGLTASATGLTAAPQRFLLTLFNLRFGCWLPNPLRGSSGASRLSLRHLLAELLGTWPDWQQYVMVSDGSRFDNLGLYELVKRRCRIIFVVDAEYDPGLTCPSLTRVMQLCEQDFGVTFQLDLTPLRAPQSSRDGRPFVVGTITHADGAVATLVFLKATVIGVDDTMVENYGARNAAFPHEDIGLVFSDDDQFEMYRRLGQLVAERAVGAFVDTHGMFDWNLVLFPRKLARRRGQKPRIFISYRKSDTSGYAQLLREHVAKRFDSANVFIDVHGIEPGRDYPSVLHARLQSCDAALVVIGPGWLTASVNGTRRLDRPDDWVRAEVAAVLARDVLVIPVLVGGARVPDAGELPTDLAPLAERQGVALPDRGFLEVLGTILDSLEGRPVE